VALRPMRAESRVPPRPRVRLRHAVLAGVGLCPAVGQHVDPQLAGTPARPSTAMHAIAAPSAARRRRARHPPPLRDWRACRSGPWARWGGSPLRRRPDRRRASIRRTGIGYLLTPFPKLAGARRVHPACTSPSSRPAIAVLMHRARRPARSPAGDRRPSCLAPQTRTLVYAVRRGGSSIGRPCSYWPWLFLGLHHACRPSGASGPPWVAVGRPRRAGVCGLSRVLVCIPGIARAWDGLLVTPGRCAGASPLVLVIGRRPRVALATAAA